MSITNPDIATALEALRKTLTWFRSNPDLRRYCAISSMDEQKLRLIDRLLSEGLGHGMDSVDEDEIRAIIEAALALERTVNSEILPVIHMRISQRGPARSKESVTRLRMTLDSIEPNTTRLVQEVCALRVAALSSTTAA